MKKAIILVMLFIFSLAAYSVEPKKDKTKKKKNYQNAAGHVKKRNTASEVSHLGQAAKEDDCICKKIFGN